VNNTHPGTAALPPIALLLLFIVKLIGPEAMKLITILLARANLPVRFSPPPPRRSLNKPPSSETYNSVSLSLAPLLHLCSLCSPDRSCNSKYKCFNIPDTRDDNDEDSFRERQIWPASALGHPSICNHQQRTYNHGRTRELSLFYLSRG